MAERYIAPIVIFSSELIAIALAVGFCTILPLEYAMSTSQGQLHFVMYGTFLLNGQSCKLRGRFAEYCASVFRSTLFAGVAILLIITAFPHENFSMPIEAALWLLSYTIILILHQIVRELLKKARMWQRTALVIGAGLTAEKFIDELSTDYRVIGFVEDRQERKLLKKYPHLGNFQDIERVLSGHPVQEVILAIPGCSRKRMIELFHRVQPYVRHVTLIPDLFGIPMGNMHIATSLSVKLPLLRTGNNLNSFFSRGIKRTLDLLAGIIICIALLPILAILTILIKLDSHGPVFHNASRIGKDGKEFRCYKFRSMYLNADEILKKFLDKNPEAEWEWQEYAKIKGADPRVTKVGKWMRKYSLDELPQIFNVLKGEMSLVGPRPYLPREKEKMGAYFSVICMTVPGITGLWQVSGRNDVKFSGRLELDAWYVRNWTVWQDFAILVKTISVVFGRKGAY